MCNTTPADVHENKFYSYLVSRKNYFQTKEVTRHFRVLLSSAKFWACEKTHFYVRPADAVKSSSRKQRRNSATKSLSEPCDKAQDAVILPKTSLVSPIIKIVGTMDARMCLLKNGIIVIEETGVCSGLANDVPEC